MKVGRKKTPITLRVLEGNPGKRPLPKNEPRPDPAAPSAPTWLHREAKREWRRVCKQLNALGLLTKLDRAAFAAYCQAYAEWYEAEKLLKEAGRVYVVTDDDGNVKKMLPRPEVALARDARKELMSWCSEFGFTPSARAGIVVPGANKKEKDSLLSS